MYHPEYLQHGTLTSTDIQRMNTSTFAIATIVDLVLTGAFVTIMRQSRTGFLRYVLSESNSATSRLMHTNTDTD